MKKIFLLALVTSLSANTASALEITGGKLISHKETVPANFSASFKNIKPSDNFMKLIASQSSVQSEVTASNVSYPNGGNVNEAIQIRGFSFVFIKNSDHNLHRYTVTTHVCAKPNLGYDCAKVEDVLDVEPNGDAYLSTAPSVMYKYSDSGLYSSAVVTSVLKDGQPAFRTISNSYIDIGG
ncbi:MAG: hypothetical protein P4M12_10085 [Gammaproteobacteria bacterium]|nr:hypothetical protein [Gammaproteobacteria bacterium]